MVPDEPFCWYRRRTSLLVGIVVCVFIIIHESNSCNVINPFQFLTACSYTRMTVSILPKRELSKEDQSLCFGKGYKPKLPNAKIETLDHLDFRQETFNYQRNFKNPCFYRNVTYYNGTRLSQPINVLRCVPYFFIIGLPKCGTTDLWHGLKLHPDIAIEQVYKESKFFNIKRYPIDVLLSDKTDNARNFFLEKYKDSANWTLDMYLDHFHNATLTISSSNRDFNGNKPHYNAITGDGSVGVSHNNNHWHVVPGNEDCNEPLVLNAHYLYKLNPKMKLIMMVRNPIERLYSNYLYDAKFLKYKTSVEDFHQAVIEALQDYRSCLKYFTERGCAYNSTIGSYKVNLRVGMYYIFLADWFRVFPRKQIMIIRLEDYSKDRALYLENAFKFLELRKLSADDEVLLTTRSISNSRSKDEIGDMMNKTRRILQEFYLNFNKRLSDLLNDGRFIWKDS